jgi:hypothetical protein
MVGVFGTIVGAEDAIEEKVARVAVLVGGIGVGTGVDVGGIGVAVGFGVQEARVLPPASARAYKTDRRRNSRRDSIISPLEKDWRLEIRDWNKTPISNLDPLD